MDNPNLQEGRTDLSFQVRGERYMAYLAIKKTVGERTGEVKVDTIGLWEGEWERGAILQKVVKRDMKPEFR